MSHNRIEDAKFGLQLVLGFFPRVDSRTSVVLGINTGMLALLAGKLPNSSKFDWTMLIAVAAALMLCRSYWCLFRASFPDLKGGVSSLIYFREIAKRPEEKFIQGFSAQNQEEYYEDMMGQVWRNSQILSKKFDALRSSYIWMLLAVIPWAIAVGIFVSQTNPPQSEKPRYTQVPT